MFGLLTTMRAYDVITQTPEGKYALGLRLFEYGRQVERKWDISRVARPYMEHLSQRTGASVMLSICEGGSVITLDQVEARDKLRIVSDAGARPVSYTHLIRFKDGQALLYLYRPAVLHRDLQDGLAQRILTQAGYACGGCGRCVAQLIRR